MKYIKVMIGVFVLAPMFVLASLNIIFCGTDVVYVSSDGKWSGRQMIYKNREFKDVVSSFEEYKVKCNAPDAKLERFRSRPEWIVFDWWVKSTDDEKSKVPLSNKFLDVVTFGFAIPSIEPADCYKSV